SDSATTGDVERDGWALESAEERQKRYPDTFVMPDRRQRENLLPGAAAQLLFDIETRESGRVIDRGVDRMWVIVKRRVADRYLGVVVSDPGIADNLRLRPGSEILFGPEHI